MSAVLSEERELRDPREGPTTDSDLANDRTREEYLDALFRDLDEDLEDAGVRERRDLRGEAEEPATARTQASVRAGGDPVKRLAALVLMATGLVLIAGGLIGTLVLQARELFLSVMLGMNVVAVLCIAAGVLLLPMRPTTG